jgi:hypothetical protein
LRIVQLDDLVTGTVTRSADFGVTFIDFGSSAVVPNLLSYSARRPASRARCHSASEAATTGVSSGPSSSTCLVTQPSASTSK